MSASRRKRRLKTARLQTDRDRLAREVARLRGQNLELMIERALIAVPAPSRERALPERSYAKTRLARHVARVELRIAAARYGQLANRRARPHAAQEEFDRAKRELEDAAQAFVDSEIALVESERAVAQEARLA